MREGRAGTGAGAALLLLGAATLVSPQGVQWRVRPGAPAAAAAAVLRVMPHGVLVLYPRARARLAGPGTTRPALAAIALSIKSRAVQDSRCYLAHGGAVESFYIAEDTPVGSVIGTLSVNGDASLGGDISLRLVEADGALALAPASKNVTLRRALDREQRAGPASLYRNVRCERRGAPDPSFVIPVSVRVWDVNDNAPVWDGAPYRARLSELSAVGARLPLSLRAADADQPGPHAALSYRVLPGPHSEYFEFPNELESVLVIAKPLDYETERNLTVTLRASDAGAPPLHADAELYVEVLDADDQNPAFTFPHYTAVLPENATEDTALETSPGPIAAADQDRGIRAPVTYSVVGAGAALLRLDADSGRARAAAALPAALPATLVIKATQYDNADRYALATLHITRAGEGGGGGGGGGAVSPPPLHFSRREYSVSVREDAPPGALLATLHTSRDPAAQPPLQFYVSERAFLERFAVNAAGELLLRAKLDYEERAAYSYRVMVTDGRANDTASLNITVVNVNEWEPRFRHAQYEFAAPREPAAGTGSTGSTGTGTGTAAGLLRLGRLEAYDGDHDALALTLRGPHADMFYLNGSGELYLRADALQAANGSGAVLHVLATATDAGDPPRQSSVPVLVHLPAARAAAGAGLPLLAGGAAAALLLLLLLLLLAAVYARKRAKSSVASASSKPPPGPAPPPRAASPPRSGSQLSVSAGASTILAASSSSLDLHAGAGTVAASTRQPSRGVGGVGGGGGGGKARVAPQPPDRERPASADRALTATDRALTAADRALTAADRAPALMSDHLGASGRGRSGVAWPSATIPARVKKLSWDDADHTEDQGSLLQATHPALHDHLNLTVYF